MGIAEEIACYRAKLVRDIDQQDDQLLPPEVAKAQKTIANFEKRKRDRQEQKVRLNNPPLDPESCPECQANGIENRMIPKAGTDNVWCGACGLEIPV